MMGPRQKIQAALSYEFSLETHVPQDQLLRSIDLSIQTAFVGICPISTAIQGALPSIPSC